MKLRKLALGKSLLAVGIWLSVTGCREEAGTAGVGAMLPGVSPRPIMAQIGEGFPPSSDRPVAESVQAEPVSQEGAKDLQAAESWSTHPVLTPAADEVVQLARAQLGDEVLLAFIENSPARFNLGADDVLYLHDVGLSAQVIAAMIRRDQSLPVPEWGNPSNTVAEAPESGDGGQLEPVAPATAVAVTSGPAPAGETTVTHNYFYNTLAPYGTWMELPDYGWCWRPTVAVVDPSWRPYAHGGRWIYTDYGWYWKSYYSWGWAPFHYGRWHLSSACGWVWLPDRYWGPAWVTWRYCDGYYGWAPLPPGAVYTSGIGMTYYGSRVSFGFGFGFSSSWYTFVPVGHFYSHRPWNYCVPPGSVGPIYNNSTVINNYVQGDGNNTVINVGPGTGVVAAATRTEIQKVSIREVTSGDPKLVRAESLSRDGTTLNVYRPQLPEQAAMPPAEITRRQRELQAQAREVSSSQAAQAAVVRARSTERTMAPSLSSTPRTTGGPVAAPQSVNAGASTTAGRVGSRESTANFGTGAGNRLEPQRVTRAQEPARVDTKPSETIPAQRLVNRAPTPRQPLAQPASPQSAWSSPTPRIEPVRPAPVNSVPSRTGVRNEPARTVNPPLSVTPSPAFQLAPRPATGTPSPVTPRVIAPRSAPVFQPGAPRTAPRSVAPARIAPSRTYSAPSPAPTVVPSRSSGAVRSSPSPSPARAPSAPSSAPRSGGSRNR